MVLALSLCTWGSNEVSALLGGLCVTCYMARNLASHILLRFCSFYLILIYFWVCRRSLGIFYVSVVHVAPCVWVFDPCFLGLASREVYVFHRLQCIIFVSF